MPPRNRSATARYFLGLRSPWIRSSPLRLRDVGAHGADGLTHNFCASLDDLALYVRRGIEVEDHLRSSLTISDKVISPGSRCAGRSEPRTFPPSPGRMKGNVRRRFQVIRSVLRDIIGVSLSRQATETAGV